MPESVLEIVAKIEEADGVIIGTPEYDHSIPAVLMSALAWLSYGVFPLLDKPVMITGLRTVRWDLHVPTPTSPNLKMLQKLKRLFCQMNSCSLIHCKPLIKNGDLVDLDVIQKLDAVFNDFRVFVKITDNCATPKNCFAKMLKTLTGKICKIGDQKE